MELISLSIFLGLLIFSSSIFYLAKTITKNKEKEIKYENDHRNTRIYINVDGKDYTISEIQKQFNISRSSIYTMYYAGNLEKFIRDKTRVKPGKKSNITDKKIKISTTIPDKYIIKYGIKKGDSYDNIKQFADNIGVTMALPYDWLKKKYIEIIK